MLKSMCKNKKCADAENQDDLCEQHQDEYFEYLNEMELRDMWQERFERAQQDENGNGEVA